LRFATPLVLASLVEEEKIWALQARAGELGLKLPEKVCRWLLRHHTGDLGTLSRLLESLDYASLAAQRRLTVPFISGLLGKH
jgi:DnaA family protein